MFVAGDLIPTKDVDANGVGKYMADVKEKAQEMFL